MDALKDMALFVEVAHARSFTGAAAMMGVPTSTVSRRIAGLEKSLGVRLLNRTTRQVVLTEVGESYLEACRQIIEQATSVNRSMRDSVKNLSGVVRITAPPVIFQAVLAPIVSTLNLRYPDIRLEVEASARQVNLIAERFDIAIRAGEINNTSLVIRRLAEYQTCFYASPAYLARAGVPMLPADLERHCCILRRKQGQEMWSVIHPVEGTHRVEVCGSLMVHSQAAAVAAFIEGAGVARLIDVGCDQAVAAGRLVRVLPDCRGVSFPFNLLTVTRNLPTRTRRIVDFIVENMRGSVLQTA